MNRCKRTGARRIDDAIGAAQVKAIGDAPGRHIAKQARKRVLLPADVGVGDALHDIFGNIGFHACLFQRAAPVRMAQSCAQWDHQLQRAGNAENHAGAFAIERACNFFTAFRIGGAACAARRIAGISQRPLCRHQAQ